MLRTDTPNRGETTQYVQYIRGVRSEWTPVAVGTKVKEGTATGLVVKRGNYREEKSPGTRSVEAAAADNTKREGEQRVVLGQELGGTSVEGGGGGEKTSRSAGLVNSKAATELASHEEQEGQVEEGEEGDQGQVDLEGGQSRERWATRSDPPEWIDWRF